ncbi:MAG: hypothetical protein DI551_03570 [Micavibrio aeruginosavorus]|uniref:Uncharacterized protein n=1 Tax=Micavibrio aeruginosavorus TaxID=349221 RepID=A0A2W5N9F1_9BACT|nr:MAG: hypothetical protein DI551_03570 [Micavibrio aeruginosavorus]
MAKVESFMDLFVHELSDLYNAEKQLTKALPKMAKAANDPQLKKGFETHLKETEGQIEILDQVFELCECKPERVTCEAMKGLIEEGSEAIDEFDEGPLRDVALIIAAQKVEHYEIAGYGSMCALAEKLGLDEAVSLLRRIEEQEAATDKKLTQAAMTINEEAYKIAAE